MTGYVTAKIRDVSQSAKYINRKTLFISTRFSPTAVETELLHAKVAEKKVKMFGY